MITTAPTITYDPALVSDISARFDLRKPNALVLESMVKHVAASDGFTEAIADVATGVGKTYAMAALVEYFAAQGIRNILVVSPGSTIQKKTITNFTPGHPKYIAGGEYEPFIITPDNFQTGNTGSVLHDHNRLKLFVFNVQQLIAPTQKMSRKVRDVDENIGDSLYAHLREAPDLVVIADEHHIYSEKAKMFSAAIRDLNPLALLGLTATPAPGDQGKVIFQYSLGAAIADSFVKIPVIVYRRDGQKDERTQLADACHLLRAKEAAYAAYREQNPDKAATKPCLFVVGQSITHAQEVAALLTQPGLIGEAGSVLEVNSSSTDAALQALADVEQENSPIRAIVSVDMLKEGWDVKRIAVIVALRKLASECLTEQILGRGLRLPFGTRTGIPAVDQVDIVAHDSYQKLLQQKDVLLQKVQIEVDLLEESNPSSEDLDRPPSPSSPMRKGHIEQPAMFLEGLDAPTLFDSDVAPEENIPEHVGLRVVEMEEMVKEDERPPYVERVALSPQIIFPKMRAKLVPLRFSMSQVSSVDARLAGTHFLNEVPSFLYRDALNAMRTATGEVRINRTPEKEQEAYQRTVLIELVRHDLRQALLALPEVQKESRERTAVARVVDAFLEGAGVSSDDQDAQWGESRKSQAVEGIRAVVRKEMSNRRQERIFELEPKILPIEPVPNAVTADAYNAEFKKFVAFAGWRRSIMPFTSFDAKSTEWALAHMLDRDPDIQWWLRLASTGPAYIPLETGTSYYPDFIAIDSKGVYWLIEGKSDKEASTPEVTVKKKAAEDWARFVRDEGGYGTWRYLFATETHLKGAGSWEALKYAAKPE